MEYILKDLEPKLPLKYFEDGSHLTEYGRQVYAQYLTEQIYDHYYS